MGEGESRSKNTWEGSGCQAVGAGGGDRKGFRVCSEAGLGGFQWTGWSWASEDPIGGGTMLSFIKRKRTARAWRPRGRGPVGVTLWGQKGLGDVVSTSGVAVAVGHPGRGTPKTTHRSPWGRRGDGPEGDCGFEGK